jgi:hypothetical protein
VCLGISEFISASSLGEIVERMVAKKCVEDSDDDKENQGPQYSSHLLSNEHKDSVFR